MCGEESQGSNAHEHSFDAVVKLKGYTDKQDLFYIYSLNKKKMNNGRLTLIFKTCEAA